MQNPFAEIEARLINIETLLFDLIHKPQAALNAASISEPDVWFNLDELVAYLPDRPAKATVYGWVHTSVIPYHKGAKKLRFLKSEIDKWMNEGRKTTTTESANLTIKKETETTNN